MDELLNSTTVVSDADLLTLLNEGAVELAKLAEAFVVTGSWSAVASARTYVLSGASAKVTNLIDIFWELGLVYTQSSGVTKTAPTNFTWTTEQWLDIHLPGWRDASASDALQYAYLTHDSSGQLLLGVHPKSSTATPSFSLAFLARGTDMTNAAVYPWTGNSTNLTHTEPYQKGIAFYAQWQLHELKTLRLDLAKMYSEKYLAVAAVFKTSQRRLRLAEVHGNRLDEMVGSQESVGSL